MNSRLKESVASLQLLMLIFDDFYAVDDVHETGLQSFGLSGDVGQSDVCGVGGWG